MDGLDYLLGGSAIALVIVGVIITLLSIGLLVYGFRIARWFIRSTLGPKPKRPRGKLVRRQGETKPPPDGC